MSVADIAPTRGERATAGVASPAVGRTPGSSPGEPRRVGYAFIAPALILYATSVLAPFAHTIYLSFFSWDGVGPRRFVGFGNFRAIFGTSALRDAFLHAFVLIFFYAVLTTLIGLVLTGVMARSRVRGMSVYRALLFLPYVIAPTAIAVIWQWLLAADGPINAALAAVGLGAVRRPWLGDFSLALPAVGLVGTWIMYGLALALFLAGVQKIPTDLYEAARIDGAGPVREFLVITLPGLRNEIVVVLVLTVTAALRNFDLIYVMTQGGPGSTTQVPSWLVYNQAFVVGAVGAAAAIGVVLAVLIFVVNFIITRLGTGWAS
jgi:raffinose/stachyose/melibiose transport system permease protein